MVFIIEFICVIFRMAAARAETMSPTYSEFEVSYFLHCRIRFLATTKWCRVREFSTLHYSVMLLCREESRSLFIIKMAK